MNTADIIKGKITAGVWEGSMTWASDDAPALTVTHEGQVLDGLRVTKASDDQWHLRLPIPRDLINDGVQTVLINDATGTMLARFAILSGDVLAQDLRAEIALLRSELDMLKSAFRQHCTDG